MEELYALLESGDEWAKQKAMIALSIADSYAKNEISELEYKELLQDMIRSEAIDAEASSLEMATAVVRAINIASMVV